MRWNNDDYGGRIMNYLINGNTEMIKFLFAIDFLNKNDVLDSTGHYRHLSSEAVPFLHIVARYGCPNYMKMIDVLLQFGVDINDESNESTPTEEAIVYKNFAIAAYLMKKGGKYNIEHIRANNAISDVDLFENLEKSVSDLNNSL
jgi:ankyrin repeat protein